MKNLLATGRVAPDATLTVELISPQGMPQIILITWPVQPTPVQPTAYADAAARAMRVLARASVELSQRRAGERA
jgi:hypothetical protein